MSTNTYLRVVGHGAFDHEVKKSRFLVRYRPVASRPEALDFVDFWRKEFPDARHHCWVYCVGGPLNPYQIAMSDDGEPTGTAAKPMLNAIIGKNIGDICVVVIRYFGGTKLGAGGLIRAYGGSVAQALDQAEKGVVNPSRTLQISMDFSLEQKVRHWLELRCAKIENVQYTDSVTMKIKMDADLVDDMNSFFDAYQIKSAER